MIGFAKARTRDPCNGADQAAAASPNAGNPNTRTLASAKRLPNHASYVDYLFSSDSLSLRFTFSRASEAVISIFL